MRQFLASAVLALTLAACAETPPAPLSGTVRMAPDLTLTLPKPSSLGRSLEVSQLVTAHYGEQTFVFEGHLSATPERFLLVGLDAMGRKALSITWTEAGVTTETAPWLPQALRPDNMLADIVLLYWPEAVVRQALGSGTLTLGPHSRSVEAAGQEAIHADYQPARNDDPWTGTLIYRNLAYGYQLDIQSVEQTP